MFEDKFNSRLILCVFKLTYKLHLNYLAKFLQKNQHNSIHMIF